MIQPDPPRSRGTRVERLSPDIILITKIIWYVSDCYSGQSTRGVPGGRVSGWRYPDQELDGNTKAHGLRQVRAAMSVIPYVLCSGLY